MVDASSVKRKQLWRARSSKSVSRIT